jgi:hypothetical protein
VIRIGSAVIDGKAVILGTDGVSDMSRLCGRVSLSLKDARLRRILRLAQARH